jgi:hypothetical protein
LFVFRLFWRKSCGRPWTQFVSNGWSNCNNACRQMVSMSDELQNARYWNWFWSWDSPVLHLTWDTLYIPIIIRSHINPVSSFRDMWKFVICHSREWQRCLFDIIWFFTLWSSSWDNANSRKGSTDLENQVSMWRQDVNLYIFITEFFNK